MAKAIDIGTCFIVGAEYADGKEEFIVERDAFFTMPKEDFAEEMLNRAGASYLSHGDSLYVVGDDALRFSMITGNNDNYRRPMAKGIINPGEEESIAMLEILVEGILSEAATAGEIVAATVPADPADADGETNTYHRMIVERFLRKLGYEPKILNEAMALIFAENPSVELDGETVPFTGIALSFGAGMINMAASWRAKRLLEFSVSRGGDWIDAEVARVRNLPTARVTYIKEKYLDFDNLDAASNDLVALDIYYEELIRYAVDNFIREYVATRAAIEEPLEIIVGGGTSLAPGFGRKFRDIIQTMDLPFRVKGIRIARDPLLSVASGALIAAMAEEKKTATGDVNRLSIGKAKAGEPAKAKPAAEIDTISLEVDNNIPERMKGKIPAKSTDATGESFSLDS